MLVTNGVIGVLRQHGRKIALLEVPDTLIIEYLGDLFDELNRLIEVIEHRDGCDDLRLSRAVMSFEGRRREVVCDDLDVRLIELAELGCSRIHPHRNQLWRIEGKQGAVITADIENEVPA